jgi:T5SS/PEP-CTERM-associated repeat protein
VAGAESIWSNRYNLSVGVAGAGNALTVSNGGKVYNGNASIGEQASSSNNTVLVTGAGSAWDNSGNLSVGLYGSGNAMRIEDGGRVFSAHGTIGNETGSDNNMAVVTGAGSLWSNDYNLNIGGFGSGNSLEVSGGGRVDSGYGFIGELSSSINNTVLVKGAGSVWSNATSMYVGYAGNGNNLSIQNGGRVESMSSWVGYDASASNNLAIVEGAGSEWISNNRLAIGVNGAGNVLQVSTGGRVESGSVDVGMGINSVNNGIEVGGAGSELDMTGSFVLGNYGAGNNLSINDGGLVHSASAYMGLKTSSIGNSAMVSGSGSTWELGDLYIGFESSSNSMSILEGGVVESGSAIIGADTSAENNRVRVSGRGEMFIGDRSEWRIDDDLTVGLAGAGNTLDIEDGGLVYAWNTYAGETTNAWFNTVTVTGSNSELRVVNDLSLGGRMSQIYNRTENGWQNEWIDGGRGNSLYVGDGGLVSVGRDMHNRNYSLVSVDPGNQIVVSSNYYQDATSVLRFGVETNAAGAPLNALVSVDGTAEFEAGATLQYHSNVGVLEFDEFYTNLIVEADQLIVGGVTNANALDLTAFNLDGSLVDLLLWEQEQDIYGLVGRRYLADNAGFTPGSMMARLAREIDDLSLLGDVNAVNMVNLLNTMSGSQQNAQMSQLYSRGTANFLHSQSMTEGMSEIQKHTSRFQTSRPSKPEGVAGPYSETQELQIWVKPYGAWSDYSPDDGFEDYDHNIYGTVVGFDKPLENILVGFAGGYGRSVIRQDDSDKSEGRTGYGVLYANAGTKDWFSHANVAVGFGSVDQRSGTIFGNTADFNTGNFATYLEGGRQVKVNRHLSVTPKASMLWSYYYQEGYTEKSNLGVEREVDSYGRNSFLSSLGTAVAYQQEYDTLILKPEARLYWLHEFNSDIEKVDYQLVNGSGEYHFWMPAPEEDVIETGLGISGKFNDELELVLDIDWRFGQDYSAYAVSGRVAFEF